MDWGNSIKFYHFLINIQFKSLIKMHVSYTRDNNRIGIKYEFQGVTHDVYAWQLCHSIDVYKPKPKSKINTMFSL